VKLPLPRAFWVESVAIGDGVVVASSPVAPAAYRVDLATRAVHAIAVHGRVNAVATRGRMVAIAAGNCVAGRLGSHGLETPSYCGMPSVDVSYDAVALSPDGTRVVAVACPPDWRSRGRSESQPVARFDVEVLVNEVVADPPWQPATATPVTLAVNVGCRFQSLGWLGATPALLDEEGVVRIEGDRSVRAAWPDGFGPRAFAWGAAHAVAIDAKGRLAFVRERGLEISDLRVDTPWANVALSPNGRWLAYAAGFALICVFDLGADEPKKKAKPKPGAKPRAKSR
jgi:hypothetical protein